jgi:splicing factor 3B subunit 3
LALNGHTNVLLGWYQVCAENFVIYKKENHADVRAVIPRRADLPGDRGVLIVATATSKLKNTFFFLLQVTENEILSSTSSVKYRDSISKTCATPASLFS